ncbi:MAG TPA: zf-HC2 domain-containing protein [Pyrinomonadaceae bacterium]|nr:zf-HC2 domain-containing protein [Pyrinomonadaceae bacterium]
MNCDWAEKVSALIDGELAADETRAVEEHVKVCASCRDAAQSFRALRREIDSYGPAADPSAQRRVLAAVLASKAGAVRGDEASARRVGTSGRRETTGVRGRLAGLFGGRMPAPAVSAALALLLVAVALGLLAYVNSRRSTTNVNLAARDDAPAAKQAGGNATAARQNDPQPEATPAPVDGRRHEVIADGVNERVEPRPEVVVDGKKKRRVVVAREPRRRAAEAAAPLEVAGRARPEGNDARGVQPSDGAVASASSTDTNEPRRVERAGALDAARHAEQAQMLLRSFRNARLADGGVADERARSKKLLYRNIVLRREAATKRDAVVAQALDRLEPILLDIANLPDDPAEEDVNSIRERMRKKNIVVLLQASTANAATRKRSY